jgi:phosphoglycolate phosphatase
MEVSTSATAPSGPPKVLYTDLDGTLLGPGGSLFSSADGGATVEAAQALLALRDADVELVLMSGRTRRGLHEAARVLGATSYVAELGAVLVMEDGGTVWDVEPFDAPPPLRDSLSRSGVAGLLLERFRGRLEPVAPWTEVSVMFQGHVDVAEVRDVLAEAGFAWLAFHDNGRLRRVLPHLDVPEVHAYHLLPGGVSKASAVRRHQEIRGITPERTVGVGDSIADLDVAAAVGRFFLVQNGLAAIGDVALPPGAVVTERTHGDGFAEAVRSVLGG